MEHKSSSGKRGFSAREVRALLWLLPVLAVASWLVWEIARVKTPDNQLDVAAARGPAGADSLAGGGAEEAGMDDEKGSKEGGGDAPRLFVFDPNTVEYHDLIRLGFERGEALGIVKYRERGKVFEIPEDFAACYQVSEAMYLRLRPYISIGEKYRLKPFARTNSGGNSGGNGGGNSGGNSGGYAAGEMREAAGEMREGPREMREGPREAREGPRKEREWENRSAGSEGQRAAGSEGQRGTDSTFVENKGEWMASGGGRRASEGLRAAPVDLNAADSAALIEVAGIGPRTVMRIIELRDRLGGFASVRQLADVSGMTEQNYYKILEQVFVDPAVITKININFAPAKSLAAHPYIRAEALRKLLKERQLKGGWRTTEELENDDIFTEEEMEKLGPYLIFE